MCYLSVFSFFPVMLSLLWGGRGGGGGVAIIVWCPLQGTSWWEHTKTNDNIRVSKGLLLWMNSVESDNDLPLFMSRLKTVMKKRRNQNEVPD